MNGICTWECAVDFQDPWALKCPHHFWKHACRFLFKCLENASRGLRSPPGAVAWPLPSLRLSAGSLRGGSSCSGSGKVQNLASPCLIFCYDLFYRGASLSLEPKALGSFWGPFLHPSHPPLSFLLLPQNRQAFNSLSTAAEDGAQRLPGPVEVMPGRTPACTPVPEPRSRGSERRGSRDELSCEESDCGAAEDEGGGKEEDTEPWRGGGAGAESPFQLGGELDIEQIENN